MEEKIRAKHIVKTSEELWNQVLRFKIDNKLKNNNEAVVTLIKLGLEYVKAYNEGNN